MAPKAFLSYSHDSDAHKEWVLKLATDLVSNGVETALDQWDLRAGQDIVAFMAQGIAESDRVLMAALGSTSRRPKSVRVELALKD